MFIEELPWMLPNKLWFMWRSGFRGEDSNVKIETNNRRRTPSDGKTA
jgi:hypothetical protein